jgi:FkbM family methyltransferase
MMRSVFLSGINGQLRYLRSRKVFRRSPLRTLIRLLAWKTHCLLSREATVSLLEDSPLKIVLPPAWHGQSKLYYSLGWRGDEDLLYLYENAKPGWLVFDIGANIGAWSLLLSAKVGAHGCVVACEPCRQSYSALAKNISVNHLKNVTMLDVALSEAPGTAPLYHDIDATRNSLGPTREKAGEFETIRSITLDAAVRDLQISRVDFLKIDVEGAEPLVLRGARQTIEEFKPAILFEINAPAMKALGLPHDTSWKILREHGYEFYSLESGHLVPEASCPPGGNIWAIHKDWKQSLL